MSDLESIERAVEKLGDCQEADREHIPDDVSENQFGDGYHCFWCQEEVELDLVTDGGTDGHGQAIEHEPRYHYSRERDAYYRIDVWSLAGDGSVVPKEWTQVPADQVPPNHRADTLERDPDEW